jgi:hypothetical protein
MIFHLPVKISTNKIYAGLHWTARKKIKKSFAKVLFVAQPVTEFPVDVYYNFHLKGKRLDSLNLAFMAKMIEDCIVAKGILTDDTPKYVRRSILESKPAKKKYCEID